MNIGRNASIKLRSPFWISFAILWCAFNYDFIFHLFGKFNIIKSIGLHYCNNENFLLTPAGCLNTQTEGQGYLFLKRYVSPLFFMSLVSLLSGWIYSFNNRYNSYVSGDPKWIKKNLQELIDMKNYQIEQIKDTLPKITNDEKGRLETKIIEYIQARDIYEAELLKHKEIKLESELHKMINSKK